MYIPSLENEIKIFNSILPSGQFWRNKNIPDTKQYALVKSFANIYNQYRYFLDEKTKELFATQTSEFLDLWERLLGIPDEIFTQQSNNHEERIRIILVKLIGLQAITKQEILNLIQKLYPEITGLTIKSGIERGTFPLTFPIRYYANKGEAQMDVYVKITGIDSARTFGNALFPMPFLSSKINVIRAILEALMPFNKNLIIE